MSKVDDRNLGILKLMKMGLLTEKQGEKRFTYKHKSKKLKEKYVKGLLKKLPLWDEIKEVTNGDTHGNQEENIEETTKEDRADCEDRIEGDTCG